MRKQYIFTIILLVTSFTKLSAQGPTLNLLGSGSTVTKGTINTEVLTGIIQQKQEELRQRVFKDIVVANFKRGDASVNNFTTFYYIYNVMKVITSEKNKTIITQNLMQRTTEFALAYGFTAFSIDAGIAKYSNTTNFYSELNNLFPSQNSAKENMKQYGIETVPTITNFKIEDIKSVATNGGDEIQKTNLFKGKIFNFLIDLTFDALINNQTVKDNNLFKDKFDKTEISIWYNADNEYQKMLAEGGAKQASALKLRAEMDKVVAGFMTNFDNYKQFAQFVKNLKAQEQALTDMTQDQFLAMRSIIKEAIEIIRLNYDNSVVSKISDFLLDYTIIEYRQDDASKANLYVDIESLISALDQHYNSKSRKSSMSSRFWYINPRPFFSIGVNYASFPNTNTLTKDASNNAQNLQNLYFASEKIGLKIKFFDRKYTRSYSPGEKFKYKGTERVWLRPQEQKTISDAHLIIYGSGLLYNIANLKSNDNFNYAIVGTGLGLTFFNGLSANIGIACPFTDKRFNKDNMYFNFGLDIPIIDYIAALTKKN